MADADIRGLDIGMLRAFDALLRERSVSRAAARLFLSQPAVSASLGRLRRAFDDPLFTRTPHGVAPTPRALALAPHVARVLAELSALRDAGRRFDPAASDRVFRIAGSDFAGERVLPHLTRTLSAAGSAVRVVWEPPGAGSLPQRLDRGEFDLAVVARLRPERGLHGSVLYEDRYVYALRAGHPLAGQPLTLERFCEIPQTFLGYGSSVLDDRIEEILGHAGRRRRAQVAVTSFAQILHQLEHADHAAVLGGRIAQAYAPRLWTTELPFELPTYRSMLCWSPAAEGDPAIGWLRDEVRRAYGVPG